MALNLFLFALSAPPALYLVPVFAFSRGILVFVRSLAFPSLYNPELAANEAWLCVALSAANAALLLVKARCDRVLCVCVCVCVTFQC